MTKWALVGFVVSAFASACANKVAPNRATGPDGNIKNAKPLALDDEGNGDARGIVTWPGGDRVDWKQIVIPEGKKGKLELQMSFTTPRPGLHVQFDVFDARHKAVFKKAKGEKHPPRERSIDNAMGTYFVRVYAPSPADAGEYKLEAAFHEVVPVPDFNPIPLNIPGPPKVAQIPMQTCPNFDPADPTCTKETCWTNAPVDWPGCKKPDPPPAPPTPPTPTVPVVTGPTKPVVLRVLKVDVNGDGLDVTLGGGSENGVGKDYKTAHVLRGSTSSYLPSGTGSIVRINKTTTVIHVKMTSQLIGENQNIEVAP